MCIKILGEGCSKLANPRSACNTKKIHIRFAHRWKNPARKYQNQKILSLTTDPPQKLSSKQIHKLKQGLTYAN